MGVTIQDTLYPQSTSSVSQTDSSYAMNHIYASKSFKIRDHGFPEMYFCSCCSFFIRGFALIYLTLDNILQLNGDASINTAHTARYPGFTSALTRFTQFRAGRLEEDGCGLTAK